MNSTSWLVTLIVTLPQIISAIAAFWAGKRADSAAKLGERNSEALGKASEALAYNTRRTEQGVSLAARVEQATNAARSEMTQAMELAIARARAEAIAAAQLKIKELQRVIAADHTQIVALQAEVNKTRDRMDSTELTVAKHEGQLTDSGGHPKVTAEPQ